MNYRVGDAVIYDGELYYIADGPIMSTEGNKYRLSKVPPEILVNEQEIRKAPNDK